jgi:hypothetical protein
MASWIPVSGDVEHVAKSAIPVSSVYHDAYGALTDTTPLEANRNCPKFNANSAAPSPVAATPAIPTPGTAAYGEYFAQTPSGESKSSSQPSFKIRLSGLK